MGEAAYLDPWLRAGCFVPSRPSREPSLAGEMSGLNPATYDMGRAGEIEALDRLTIERALARKAKGTAEVQAAEQRLAPDRPKAAGR